MSSLDQESLSALLDNEADDLELRRLCKALENASPNSPEVADFEARWKRYNVAKLLIHGDFTGTNIPALSPNFSRGVMAALEAESSAADHSATATAEPSTHASAGSAVMVASGWKQNVVKLAVAASVAAVAVVVMQVPVQQGVNAPASSSGLMASESAGVANSSELSLLTAGETPQNSGVVREIADLDPVAHQRLLDYIDSMSLNVDDEPIGFQRLEDSPLLRLVNEIELDN